MLIKILKFLPILIFLVLISSCKTVFKTHETKNIESIILELSSDKYKGRLAGTSENKKAAQFISSIFKDKNFTPYYGDGYTYAYNQTVVLPESKISKLLVINQQNNIRELEYGKEYLESGMFRELYFEGNITFNLYDDKLDNKILLCDNMRQANNLNKKPKAFFVVAQDFKKTLTFISGDIVPIIQINNDIYDYLKKNPDVYIKYDTKSPIKDAQAYNVISRIGESGHKKGVVLSAHFDHVGNVGDVIFNGAIDNASGVSLMIDIGSKLNKYAENHSLDYDIILCAFNGEETDKQGSKSFINTLAKDYDTIYNINLDCIGIKNGGRITLSSEQNVFPCFIDTINKTLIENNLDTSIIGTEYVSDHLSFIDANIPSISIGQENIQNIHTVKDNIREIDYNYLENFSDIVFNFIIEKSNIAFEEVGHSHSSSVEERPFSYSKETEETLNIEREKLNYLQYKLIDTDDGPITISNLSCEFTNIESIKRYYPNIKIPSELQGCKFEYLSISDSSELSKELRDNIIANKVYELKADVKNIAYINLKYSKTENNQKEVLIITITNDNFNIFKEQDNNMFSTKEIRKNSKLYTISLGKKNNLIYNISFKSKSHNRSFDVTIFRSYERNIEKDGNKSLGYYPYWTDNSSEDCITYVENLNTDAFINNILE